MVAPKRNDFVAARAERPSPASKSFRLLLTIADSRSSADDSALVEGNHH